jgi:hypothetical protein
VLNRRQFGKNSLTTALSMVLPGPKNTTGSSLIPSTPSAAPNYWCTWAAQNYVYGDNSPHVDIAVLEGEAGGKTAHEELNEELVFGPEGWATKLFPKFREDLYLLFDDGWAEGGSATFLLDTRKFPSFSGDPEGKLKRLNAAVLSHGWRGAALWCRKTPGGSADVPLVVRSQRAGIQYWKIDIGDTKFNVDAIRNQLGAPLVTEHVHGEPPFNGDWHKDGRFEAQAWNSARVQIVRQSDVYRTYDTNCILSIPTTLDRVSQLLNATQGHSEVRGLLNVEDEVYIAAVLGCTMGVLRQPLSGLRPDGDVDLFFTGPRQTKKRMDEVGRALHWHRIAAPYRAGLGFVRLDEEILTDSWKFKQGETWYIESIGQIVNQGAPARMSRNIELPQVKIADEKPFVVAGRFPNGAVAVVSQGRTSAEKGWFTPRADVTLKVGEGSGPFGIFGHFNAVKLEFIKPLRGARILGQDLLGFGRAADITSRVEIRGRELVLPGRVIEEVGLSDGTAGDLSDPAMVLQIV